MKSCFPAAAAAAADEEEGAALVPPAAAGGDHPQEEHVSAGHGPVPPPPPSSSAANKPWWRTKTSSALLSPTRGAVGVVVACLLLLAFLVGTRWIDLGVAITSFLPGNDNGAGSISRRHRPPRSSSRIPILFECGNATSASSSTPATLCHRRGGGAPAPSPAAASPTAPEQERRPPPSCPDYFRHIHSDLEPWRAGGITREAVERGQPRAHFRLTVVDGRAYLETYKRSFQTRDVFTQWGILQLLARYPGRVPDLDLMFNCEDMPEVHRSEYPTSPSDAPPLFRYCKDDTTLDVVFPDWSFWGWPEVNIRPWVPLMEEVARENARLPWADREPYAFWKGNPGVSQLRGDLFHRCNGKDEWKAEMFAQDWGAAIRNGFRGSNLAEQCRYRYKIYVEGRSWSVSEKYILACDSPMLAVASPYKDFFSRGLVAGSHYWPIDVPVDCRSIKFAVEWGNAHQAAARAMGEEGGRFAREEMAMEYVYDYMLHVLTEYAALLRYKPTVPDKAVELCPESMACGTARGDRETDFMLESRERYLAGYEPCTLPPAYTAEELKSMAAAEEEVRKRIRTMTEKET